MSTLILASLAALSISTMQNVVTEQQITGQAQDKVLALESAQYAVAEAKRLLLTNWASAATPCATVNSCSGSNGIAVWSYNAFNGYSDLTTQAANFFDAAQAVSTPNPRVAAAPRFFVISLGCDPISKTDRLRIVAKGFGASINTVAYAESTLSIPLTGQNSNGGITPAANTIGVAVSSDMSSVSPVGYPLVKSTNSRTLFFNSGGSSCSTQTGNTGASCEMNCMGEVRVKGYSYYNNNSASCPWVYGDWVWGSNQSQIQLKQSNGVMASVQCGPCQTNLSVPTAACASGLYNTCTRSCVIPSCPAGQYLNGSVCSTCVPGSYSAGGAATSCSTCAAGTYSSAGAGSCTPCPAGTYSTATGATSASTCVACPNGGTSNAGAGSCNACYCATGCFCGLTGTCWASHLCTQHGGSCRSFTCTIICPAGSYIQGSSCTTCPAGTYASSINSTSCTACTGNKYSDAGATKCQTCSLGNTNGGTSCSCPAGQCYSGASKKCVSNTTCSNGQRFTYNVSPSGQCGAYSYTGSC